MEVADLRKMILQDTEGKELLEITREEFETLRQLNIQLVIDEEVMGVREMKMDATEGRIRIVLDKAEVLMKEAEARREAEEKSQISAKHPKGGGPRKKIIHKA